MGITAQRAESLVSDLLELSKFYKANGYGGPISVRAPDFDGLFQRGRVYVSPSSGEAFCSGVTVERVEG